MRNDRFVHDDLLCDELPPQKITMIMLSSSVLPILFCPLKRPDLSLLAAALRIIRNWT
jgi:hypothetical protein